MDWEDVRNAKVKLSQEMIAGLSEVEKDLLMQLLRFERSQRNMLRPNFRGFFQNQLNSRIPAMEDDDDT